YKLFSFIFLIGIHNNSNNSIQILVKIKPPQMDGAKPNSNKGSISFQSLNLESINVIVCPVTMPISANNPAVNAIPLYPFAAVYKKNIKNQIMSAIIGVSGKKLI